MARRLLASGVAYECRTTWHAGLFSVDDLLARADTQQVWTPQHRCRPDGCSGWIKWTGSWGLPESAFRVV